MKRDLFRPVIRTVYAVIFAVASVFHVVLGRTAPEGYAVFGETAALPGLASLCSR